MALPQMTVEEKDYGEVCHSTILKIFGDEMVYNELKFYTKDKHGTSYLETKTERNNELGFCVKSVFIDRIKVMEKRYDMNWSCDMNYYLSELEAALCEDESDDEDEDECVYVCEDCCPHCSRITDDSEDESDDEGMVVDVCQEVGCGGMVVRCGGEVYHKCHGSRITDNK
tara:strand:+ start:273 stop:782 length:510 start_codon:yes stop_codon:yes gene_type:complete